MATGVPSELNSLKTLAGPTGFEPATSCVTGRRSNQTELRPRLLLIVVGSVRFERTTFRV